MIRGKYVEIYVSHFRNKKLISGLVIYQIISIKYISGHGVIVFFFFSGYFIYHFIWLVPIPVRHRLNTSGLLYYYGDSCDICE